MSDPKLLFFAGSARKDSFNKRLAKAAHGQAQALGAQATFIDLAHFDMPLYNGDWEAELGIPDKARELRELVQDHDGLCIASPEYNSGFSPLLKNCLDWISRPDGDLPGMVAYKNKTAQLLAASPGALGGLRGLVMVRMLLGNMGVMVMPGQLAIPAAHKAFDDDGQLLEQRQTVTLDGLLTQFIATTAKLKAG